MHHLFEAEEIGGTMGSVTHVKYDDWKETAERLYKQVKDIKLSPVDDDSAGSGHGIIEVKYQAIAENHIMHFHFHLKTLDAQPVCDVMAVGIRTGIRQRVGRVELQRDEYEKAKAELKAEGEAQSAVVGSIQVQPVVTADTSVVDAAVQKAAKDVVDAMAIDYQVVKPEPAAE